MPYSTLAYIRPIKIRINAVTLALQNYLCIKRLREIQKQRWIYLLNLCPVPSHNFDITSQRNKTRFLRYKNALKFMIGSLNKKAFGIPYSEVLFNIWSIASHYFNTIYPLSIILLYDFCFWATDNVLDGSCYPENCF